MALCIAFSVAVAASLGACAPSRLEGYDSILCSGSSIYEQLGIDLEQREYGMFDFRSGFAYCSTSDYHCMDAPLVISMPKDPNTLLDRVWTINRVEFRYARVETGFQVVAVTPPNDLSPRSEITSRFSEDGDLVEVVHRPHGEGTEVQRVCHGRINLSDLF